MNVEKIDVDSWQPLVVSALHERLSDILNEILEAEQTSLDGGEEKKHFLLDSFMGGRPSTKNSLWKMITVLLHCEWKNFPETDSLLSILWTVIQMLHSEKHLLESNNETQISLRDYQSWLPKHSIPSFSGRWKLNSRCICPLNNSFLSNCRRKTYKKRKQLDQLKRSTVRIDDRKIKTLSPTASSGSDTISELKIRRSNRLNKRAAHIPIFAPTILEDSDGFPLHWSDNCSSNAACFKQILDDIVLDMLFSQTISKNEECLPITDAWCAAFFGLIRKTLPFSSSSTSGMVRVWKYIDHIINSDILNIEKFYDSSCLTSLRSLSNVKCALLTFRHGLAAVFVGIKLLQSLQSRDLLRRSVQFLLKQAKFICNLLSTASECCDFELLRTGGCLEYLLECGHFIIVELVNALRSFLNDRSVSVETDNVNCMRIFLQEFVEIDFRTIVLDIFIGLDLLATVNYRSFSFDSSSSVIENVYYGKLVEMHVSLSSLIVDLHRSVAYSLHTSQCRQSSHDRCCWPRTVGRHHLSFEVSKEQDVSHCGVVYLERIVVECYRNATSQDTKEVCLVAFESFPSCCCQSKFNLLTNFTTDGFAELNYSMQIRLLKCLETKLRPCQKVHDNICSTCANFSISVLTFNADKWNALLNSIGDASSSILLFFRFLSKNYQYLDAEFGENLLCDVVLPFFVRTIEKKVDIEKDTSPTVTTRRVELNQTETKMFRYVVSMCSTVCRSYSSYNAFLTHFLPLSEFLMKFPDVQQYLSVLFEKLALLEDSLSKNWSDLTTHDNPVNKFLFNKFVVVAKLAETDLSNLISDSASDFWLQTSMIFDLCRRLLPSSVLFRSIFDNYGGYQLTYHVFESCVQCLTSSNTDIRSVIRLDSLLAQTLSQILMAQQDLEKLKPVFGLIDNLLEKDLDSFVAHHFVKTFLECASILDSTQFVNKKIVAVYSGSGTDSSVNITSTETTYSSPLLVDAGYDADNESLSEFGSTLKLYTYCSKEDLSKSIVLNKRTSLIRLCLRILLKFKTFRVDFEQLVLLSLKKISMICASNDSWLDVFYDEDCFDLLLDIAQHSLGDEISLKEIRSLIIELLFAVMEHTSQYERLKNVLRLFNVGNGDFQGFILKRLLRHFRTKQMEPKFYATFPTETTERRKFKEYLKDSRSLLKRSRSSSPGGKILSKLSLNNRSASGESWKSSILPKPKKLTGAFGIFSGISNLLSLSTSDGLSKRASNPNANAALDALWDINYFSVCPDAAILLPLESKKISFEEGFSVSFWLKRFKSGNNIQMKNDSTDDWHLFSVGGENLLCALFLNSVESDLIVKLISFGEVVVEKKFTSFLPSDKWCNIVITLKLDRTEQLKLKIFCDGFRTRDIISKWHMDGFGKSNTFQVMFGAVSDECDSKAFPTFLTGNIFVFTGELNFEHAVLLNAFGPRCTSVADTKSRTLEANVSFYLTSKLISKPLQLSTLIEDQLGLTERLQKSLLLTYSPANSKVFNVYSSDEFLTRSVDSNDSKLNLFYAKPISYPIVKQCELVIGKNFALDDALDSLGGLKLLLYMFARVRIMFFIYPFLILLQIYLLPFLGVECNAEQCQAVGLRLLFTAASRNPRWWRSFVAINGGDMISNVLASRRTLQNEDFLAVIFDGFSGSFSDRKLKKFQDFIVQDPRLLSCLLLRLDAWKNNLETWTLGLKTLGKFLSDNRFSLFNREQLGRAQFLKHLLFFFTELSQSNECFIPETLPSVAQSIVMYLTCPPNVIEITMLWDFLFLSHPASSTYLNYRIIGALDWLHPEMFTDSSGIDLALYESRFGEYFHSLLSEVDQDTLNDVLSDPKTVYCKLINIVNERNLPPSPILDTLSNSKSLLPDILCDIDPSERSSDSMCTATQSLHSSPLSAVSDNDERYEDIFAEAFSENFNQNSSNIQSNSIWMSELRAGFYNILADVLITAPDAVFFRVAGPIIKWNQVLVMLRRQSNDQIRNSCVKILCIILMRSDANMKQQFVKSLGFSLLANLLREYPCTPNVIDSLFSILCGDFVRLEDGLDAEHLSKLQVDKFRCSAYRAIFAGLENSTHDLTLFWNVIGSLQKIFENNFAMAQAMLDYIPETLINVLLNLSSKQKTAVDVHDENENDLMLEGWLSFAACFVQWTVTHTGMPGYQSFTEFFHLLLSADWYSAKTGVNQHGFVRQNVCLLLELVFECVRQMFGNTGMSISTLVRFDSDPESFVYIDSKGKSLTSGSGVRTRSDKSISSNNSSSLFVSQNVDPPKLATHTELLERLKQAIQYCGDLICFSACCTPSMEEERLFDYVLQFCAQVLVASNDMRLPRYQNSFQGLLWGCRTKAQNVLIQILTCVFYPSYSKIHKLSALSSSSPHQILKRKLNFLDFIVREPIHYHILKDLFESSIEAQIAINFGLLEIRFCEQDLSEQTKNHCDALFDMIKQTRVRSPFVNVRSLDDVHDICADERVVLKYFTDSQQRWIEKMRFVTSRMKDYRSKLSSSVSSASMTVTCTTVEEQNLPRKLFIKSKKLAFSDSLAAENSWKIIIEDLCHPEAAFYDDASWPKSWCLDLIEGPFRERRRLTHCHLNIPKKFLLTEEQWKSDSHKNPQPLSYMFETPTTSSTNTTADLAGHLIERLRIDETIIYTCQATAIRLSFECSGEILLGDRNLYFVGDISRSTQKGLPRNEIISIVWSYADVTEVYRRYNHLMDVGVELFFADGQTYLIAFESVDVRDNFLHRFLQMDLPNLVLFADNLLQALTHWWREGNLTNFEYLMHLNKFAGRTFSDLMQYPVFPFVLSDYTSVTLDLNNFNVYRNFSKPIAIQNKTMENHYIQVYKSLEVDYKRSQTDASTAPMPMLGPYNYGSHYSNSGVVTHFLVRLPPFTQLVLEYQDDSFDVPDRTFHSMSTTWRLSSADSTTDFKELTPEFFFLPEFLENFEGLRFGEKQNGQIVNDVELPPWCPDGDPRLFTLIHRQALESTFVTSTLHQWIDLIFGYKQIGQAAIDAINVFHPATYHGTVVVSENCDEIHMNAIQTMVKTYGQMPKQLFKTPHLPHTVTSGRQLNVSSASGKNCVLSVNGLRWGQYVGSPDEGEPVLVLKQRSQSSRKPTSLTMLADGCCVGVTENSMPIVTYKTHRKDAVLTIVKEMERMYLLSWRFCDQIVRVHAAFPETQTPVWTNVIALHDLEISTCACFPGSNLICLASHLGHIFIYQVEFANHVVKTFTLVKTLYGHISAVKSIWICREYSIIVSGDENGLCIVWDLNKLRFVRSLTLLDGPVTHCVVGRTSGDIATVGLKDYGSQLMLHTINGRLVGTVESVIEICSLSISSAPEGVSINCIAAGLQNGVIRFWDTWTLNPVRDISHSNFLEPIISLCFSQTSQKLYACTKSGSILCWESSGTKQTRPCRYFFIDS